MNVAKRLAIQDMQSGGLLYVYIDNRHLGATHNLPPVGSGVIISDRDYVPVSRKIVSAIRNLGTDWDYGNGAEVLSDHAKRRANYLLGDTAFISTGSAP